MNLLQRVKSFFPAVPNIGKAVNTFIPINVAFPGFFKRRYPDQKIIDDGYLSNADFYSIIRKITEKIRVIPVDVKTINNKRREQINEGWEYVLLKSPNEDDTTKDLLEKAAINLLATGDCYFRFVGLGQGFPRPLTIEVLRTVDVQPQTDANNNVTSYTYSGINGQSEDLTTEEIQHIKLYDPSTLGSTTHKGLAPGNAGYNILDASNELAVADAFINKNKGAIGVLTPKKGFSLEEDEARRVQEGLNEKLGGSHKKNRVAVSGTGLEFTQIGMSPTDLKIQEAYIVKLRQLCNVFNVDSSLFNDPANKKFNNLLEAEKALIVGATIPVLERILTGLEKKFRDVGSNAEFIPNTSKLEALQKDQKSEAEKNKIVTEAVKSLNTDIRDGVISREIAINNLVSIWGMKPEQAEEIIISEPTIRNNQLETLRGLSPLLANRLVEGLTEEEVRNLLQ